MSYCRFSEGDVYMYATFDDKIVCCCCRLISEKDRWGNAEDVILWNSKEAWKHLKEHIYAGHKVPKRASDILKVDIEYDRRSKINNESNNH